MARRFRVSRMSANRWRRALPLGAGRRWPPRGPVVARASCPRLRWDEDQRWTLARIAEVIRRRFMVDYTLAGLDLLLHRIGWSVQVPAPQASERDEERVTAWKQETWPVITGGLAGK